MRYLFSKGTYNHKEGTWTMPAEYVARWDRQLNTPYLQLSEPEKDSDRAEADKFLSLIFGDDDTENSMDTVLKRALHYVECYDLQFPTSGAGWVAAELKALIEIEDGNGKTS